MITTIVLPLFSGRAGDLHRGGDGRAGADADEQALLRRRAAGPLRGRGVDLDDLVEDLGVEDVGDEVAPMPWILCGPGWPPLRIGAPRLDGDDLHVGLAGLDHLADAGDGAAGADAGDEDVDLAVGVLPDLLGRRLAVDLGVGRVGELRARTPPRSAAISSALSTAPFMPGGRVGEDELGAEGRSRRRSLLIDSGMVRTTL